MSVSHGGVGFGSGGGESGTPLRTPRSPSGARRSTMAVPSVLSSQAMALLNMRKVLKAEQMRQVRELQARLVAADVPQVEIDEFSLILDGDDGEEAVADEEHEARELPVPSRSSFFFSRSS